MATTGVSGSFKELEKLRKRIAQVASPQFKREVSLKLGAAAIKILSDQFRAGQDPYGRAWKPVLLRSGRPLQDTGRLRNSFTSATAARPTATGFSISTRVYYARTHQLGAGMDGSPIDVIRPVVAKKLRFIGRGAPTKSNKRGKAYVIFADEVRVPRRQIMPEVSTGGLGPRWARGFNDEGEALMRRQLGFPGGR